MKGKKMLIVALILLVFVTFGATAQNYSDALSKAVMFYDANKCGPNVANNNVFSWRGACHTQDGSDVGVNLNGGLHDAGDHVKFGLPQGYTFSVLNWALYEFRSALDQAGTTNKLIAMIKWMGDYILRSKSGSRFYYQVGEGEADHTYWGPPEEQTNNRPTYAYADSSHPASCVLGNTAGGLALAYLNFQGSDSTFANQCLTLARDLYNMGISNVGASNGQSFYQSSSQYDDLSWAATWLYVIDGNQSYLDDIYEYLQKPTRNGDIPLNQNHWTMCWDDMGLAVCTKLAMLTGRQEYINVVEENLRYWMNDITTTPGGMKFLDSWGVLRYAAAESMIALLYYGHTGNQAYYNLAKSQIDYILMGNPANKSYEIGYGSNWALHPHHRAANGYTYANGDNQKPAKHELTGALVGGPNQSDQFTDDVNQYQYTEVAIDYNAGFVGALAGLIKYSGGIVSTPAPTTTVTNAPTASPVQTAVPGNLGDVNGSGTVDIVDALLIAQYYVDLNPANFNPAVADTNCNGSIDIIDALLIAQYYVNLISGFCL
ncbi:MAG: glycoside hydrolase family 9 protein [Spirochaetales bacterium]|nr:glycoside hydrolase family 9 protein [Spirochaetales bacterium]